MFSYFNRVVKYTVVGGWVVGMGWGHIITQCIKAFKYRVHGKEFGFSYYKHSHVHTEVSSSNKLCCAQQ